MLPAQIDLPGKQIGTPLGSARSQLPEASIDHRLLIGHPNAISAFRQSGLRRDLRLPPAQRRVPTPIGTPRQWAIIRAKE
jgi:hypothetical protein